jgi:hypothetical protein
MDMRKHTDVDILAALKKLVDTHVRHYKEDFEVDRKFITQTVKDAPPEDGTLIWFCRECGTHCFREAQTFIRDTREHNTLRFYAEQSGEDITARIVVPKQLKGKKVMGDVYEVSFKELAFKVAQDSLEPVTSWMTFEDGSSAEVPFHKSLHSAEQLVQEHGRITSIHVIPVDKEALADILAQQKRRRERLPEAVMGENLAPLPVSEYRKYQAIKRERPSALVCFAQNGYFELYGEDAKKAAPILGTKILEKKMRGSAPIPVTGFKEEAWVVASKRLWKAGQDVFLTKDGEQVKDLKAADYIPVGAELDVGGCMCRIEKVDFTIDRVVLRNIEQTDHPVLYNEPIDYVRSFVEDAGLGIYESTKKVDAAKPDKHTSIREKLSQAKQEQPSRKAVPDKSKGKDLEL